ncbi:MAG TPA: hypothetical protein VF079_03975, partial [Sphingomicrobium sp.]
NRALRDKLLGKRAPFETVEVIGVGGATVKMELARVGQLELGPLTLRDVPIAFADSPPFVKWGLADQPALLVGADLLSRFRSVSLDFGEREIRFRPRVAPIVEASPANAGAAACSKGA